MHVHAIFGKTNRIVVNAMKRSIMFGANKARRKVDYFIDEGEQKILLFKGHLPNSNESCWLAEAIRLLLYNGVFHSWKF